MKKCFVWMLALLMLLSAACAEPQMERKGLELGEAHVYYLQVTGMEDAGLQDAVNAALLRHTGAETLLSRLPLTMHSPTPLRADYTWQLAGDVLSVAVKAEGPVLNDRSTQVWYTANIDLRTGEAIAFDDLFLDADAARMAISDELEWELAPELSAHLRNSQLTPLPETFTLSATGLTLHYPLEQLSTLSDQAGTVNIQWCEMLEYLKLQEGSLLDRIGARAMLTLDETSAGSIRLAAESGQLPGIPAKLGGSVQEAVERYRLLIDPDLYENGRLMQLEDGAFRDVYLLTDSLTDSWAHSVVQGIRADRINLHGLCTGMTAREEWQAVLGQPHATVEVDDAKADANRMQPGTSDYYNFDGVQLRLHANGEGVLVSLFITSN